VKECSRLRFVTEKTRFTYFAQTGSAYAVVHRFATEGIRFPKRAYGGAWSGKVIWGQLTHSRALGVLKNPSYAGCYVYGRYGHKTQISEGGRVDKKTIRKPMSEWDVVIHDHHPGYIRWEDYLHNQQMLATNRTNGEENMLSAAAREGLALLQGLLVCAHCGRRVSIRYKGNGGVYPMYECNGQRNDGSATKACLSARCDLLDRSVEQRVLETLQPAQFEIALKAVEELEKRDQGMIRQWQMQIQRADYEAQLAQRRYEEVDPSNRLVAATLEHRWNEALQRLQQTKEQYDQFRQKEALSLTPEQKQQALDLARDLPRLWHAPSTQPKDRKRILRLLIKDVTVEKPESKKVILHLRWQGGACEDLSVELPPHIAERLRYPPQIIDQIRQLATSLPDQQIAERLNEEGIHSATKKRFTVSMIKWVRYKHHIRTPELKHADELTVPEVARMFGVNPGVVYYWIKQDLLEARRINRGSPCWIVLDAEKKKELNQWVRQSTRINNRTLP
jgi:hypothetical protein